MANTYTDLLNLRMPALGDVGWDDEVNDNTQMAEFILGSILKSNVVISGLAPSDGGSLDVDITAGEVVVGGASYSIGADTKTCTSGVKNWLYVDDTGTLQITTDQPIGDYVALAMIDAGTSSIDRIADHRNFAEGALTIGVTHSPNNYTADSTKTGAINQHLSGIDNQLGFMGGYKNKFINGNFDLWQRGTTQTSSGYGSDDRNSNVNFGTTKTHSRQAFTPGQEDVPGNPKYYSRTIVTSVAGSSNYALKQQKIEDVRTLAGEQATLSFYIKADTTKNIAVEFYQYFGSGGSPSPTVAPAGAVTTIACTTSWQKKSLTINLPSISGKTIGTNNDSHLGVNFWYDAGSDYDSDTNSLGQQSGTFDIAQLQLEAGETATSYESRHISQELELCQRYYEKSYDLNVTPGTATDAGAFAVARVDGDVGLSVPFKVKKRAAPSIVVYSSVSGLINALRSSQSGTDLAASVGLIGTNSFKTGCSTAGVSTGLRGHFIANAEL